MRDIVHNLAPNGVFEVRLYYILVRLKFTPYRLLLPL